MGLQKLGKNYLLSCIWDPHDFEGHEHLNLQVSACMNSDARVLRSIVFPCYVHTWKETLLQIYGYRMALWAEHTGSLEECFEHPESVECTRRIKWMGEQN